MHCPRCRPLQTACTDKRCLKSHSNLALPLRPTLLSGGHLRSTVRRDFQVQCGLSRAQHFNVARRPASTTTRTRTFSFPAKPATERSLLLPSDLLFRLFLLYSYSSLTFSLLLCQDAQVIGDLYARPTLPLLLSWSLRHMFLKSCQSHPTPFHPAPRPRSWIVYRRCLYEQGRGGFPDEYIDDFRQGNL